MAPPPTHPGHGNSEQNGPRPVHAAKQEITETIKFLDWLWQTHHRTASTCTQQDADTWLTTGPTTRKAIRTFFVLAKKPARTCASK
jgi:hypothetical protein